jgi:hypothetical protein
MSERVDQALAAHCADHWFEKVSEAVEYIERLCEEEGIEECFISGTTRMTRPGWEHNIKACDYVGAIHYEFRVYSDGEGWTLEQQC